MSEPPRPDGSTRGDRPAREGGAGRGGLGTDSIAQGSDLRMDKTHWVIWKEGRIVDCSDRRAGRDDPD